MKYEMFQIVTNGEKFRIQVSFKGNRDSTTISHLPENGMWVGAESYGYIPYGKLMEFNSKQEAVDYIKKEFGEVGYRKLLESWIPC